MDTHIYTGPEQRSSTGEVLRTGDAVRVTFERDVFGVAIRGVDKVGGFANGRTYTVWSARADELDPLVTDHAHTRCVESHDASLARWSNPHCDECGQLMSAAIAGVEAER